MAYRRRWRKRRKQEGWKTKRQAAGKRTQVERRKATERQYERRRLVQKKQAL
jgi:hypothetical protein